MNNKGYIFDLLKLENGFVITLIYIIKYGWLGTDLESKFYKCIQIGFGKLEFTFSISWGKQILSIDNIGAYS